MTVSKTALVPPLEPVPEDCPLSDRELQVLRLITTGHTNKEIGALLYLAEDTVKTHLRRAFRKISARDRASAVAIGYQRGWLGKESAIVAEPVADLSGTVHTPGCASWRPTPCNCKHGGARVKPRARDRCKR
jgi:DNA-binding CsgD family transcriptional regulator